MKDFAKLLALPASLLVLVTNAQEPRWPYNLPRTVKYYPEHEEHMKREWEIQKKLALQAPLTVKKMSDDEGEKFFLDYWDFRQEHAGSEDGGFALLRRPSSLNEGLAKHINDSTLPSLLPPMELHSSNYKSHLRLLGREIFQRDFQCPSGTKSCSNVGQSDLCCQLDETCVSVSSGVGCCPAGETCGGNISGCDTAAGFTSCPNSPNGGCCVPGASCEGAGCLFSGTSTVTTTLPIQTTTDGASFTTETSSGRTQTVVFPTSNTVRTTTLTVTQTLSGTTSTRTVIMSETGALTCASGFFSCPASVGGGCCPNGQACATDHQCPNISTTTVTPGAPILPTSISVAAISATTSSTTNSNDGACPTGFYMCSAFFIGGCCRVGRNCDTTSCPPQDSTTVLTSGPTIVVSGDGASAATTAALTGTCAVGWGTCAASVGGGCCPDGFVCGVASCTATHTGQENTAKMAPSGANVVTWAWSFVMFGMVAGIGMVWL